MKSPSDRNQPEQSLLLRAVSLVLLAATVLAFSPTVASGIEASDQPLNFNEDVRPILSNHCFACHGPDEEHRESGVRLDVPDEVDLDEVIARINSDDPDSVMPPPALNKDLNSIQKQTLARWIDSGAAYEKHWAFVPPHQPEVPTPALTETTETWRDSSIDRFVLAKLQRKNQQPQSIADKRTLIRRLTFDLTGLPPTIEEVDVFLADESEDAYKNLVGRLLSSPHYGEHMARYWLDLIRFADTNGLHHDHYREMTPFRDWVIRSFNDNLSFDDFIKYQVAGDLYDDPTIDQQIASGFNRLHLIIDRGTALPEESFNRNVVDRVTAVGTAFMGLTVQCAVCHDHKYDPITQRDFYQLYGFFNNFDGQPETGRRGTIDFKRGLQPPYLELPSEAQKLALEKANIEIANLAADVKSLKEQNEARDLQKELQAAQRNLKAATSARDQILMQIPATLVMKEREDIRPAHLLIRGAYDVPGEVVERNTPGFLPPMKPTEGTKTRMDLAEWFVEPSNPLTARVTVNRIWQQFFGIGLVRTSEDFGAQGESPSHPELLDHLTTQFLQSGWDVKALVKAIVSSQTYQQSSHATTDAFKLDPKNRMLARGSRYRLDAEVIRDQVLQVCGLLSPEMHGKSVKVPQPEGLWKIVAMPSSYPSQFAPDKGEKIYRRSVYTFWKRGLPPPQMTIFDAPTRESCIARRERTNTPLQSLLMMNEPQYFSATMLLCKTLMDRPELSDNQQIATAYEKITSRKPSDRQMQQFNQARQEFQTLYATEPQAAADMIKACTISQVRKVTDPETQIELAALTMVVHAMFNMDAIKTRE